MIQFNLFFLVIGTLFCQVYLVNSSCSRITVKEGTISDSMTTSLSSSLYHRCWIIENPENYLFSVQLSKLTLHNRPASAGSLAIKLKEDSKVFEYWSQSQMETFTTTSTIEIHFEVNQSKFIKGLTTDFLLNYNKVCGEIYNQSTGVISSPNYPAKYPAEAKCIYAIRLSPGYIINVNFEFVEMENQTECSFDYVEIRDGDKKDSPLIAKICGSFMPQPMTSTSNYMRMEFKSDRSNQFRGFHATYRAVEMDYYDCRRRDSFRCLNNICVPKYDVCNGIKNCENGADEVDCDACNLRDSFHCSNEICVPKSEVCDGVKNCANGADEAACGIARIEGVAAALAKEIAWLKSKRTTTWGWHEHTPRAVLALFLAGGAKFDGKNLEEELMAKHAELKTSIAFLKNSLSNEQLSMLINGLLVICHNPRQFYGQNLIRRLKEQVQSSTNFTHPIAFLTLCNAKESWPLKAVEDLNKILSTDSNYPFIRDYQAVAVMAVSCYENQTHLLNATENSNLKGRYESTIQKFIQMQNSAGSFGNLHTTSIITQALLSSGQEQLKDWNLNATMQYLIQKLESPHDLLSSYLTLPVLNAKSLSDVANVNCTLNSRRRGYGNLSSEISDYVGPKIRVQYSLFVGDEIDAIHTISLRVPENYTAYEVMELAKTEDNKFNFRYESISGSMYVYEISGVTNDLESGLFWLLYQGLTNLTNTLVHYNIGPDQLVMQDKEHLVMWYKKAHF